MSQGTSGTFSVNGTNFNTPPTEADWVERSLTGFSGDATPIYPTPRSFQMSWSLMSMTDFAQLQTFYDTIRSSGTVIVDLPKYGATTYTFQSYTGCTLQEPKMGKFFNQYITDVVLIVNKVRTV